MKSGIRVFAQDWSVHCCFNENWTTMKNVIYVDQHALLLIP
jgi:hypothetical protein